MTPTHLFVPRQDGVGYSKINFAREEIVYFCYIGAWIHGPFPTARGFASPYSRFFGRRVDVRVGYRRRRISCDIQQVKVSARHNERDDNDGLDRVESGTGGDGNKGADHSDGQTRDWRKREVSMVSDGSVERSVERRLCAAAIAASTYAQSC